MEQIPLFERLGGRDGIHRLAQQLVANHLANPTISSRYRHASKSEAELVEGATEFFCTGLTGVPTYEGRPLTEVHAGMNISDEEFVAVIDDAVAAMEAQGIGQAEQGEVLRIFWGMKPEVVHL